ncbi:MAG: hypothetical protein J2P17_31335, partial [Mycobacterium sp.]|nr:hypothetical protein [Mycobacterium sp.]
QLSQETDTPSSGAAAQVSSFTYTPTGLVKNAVKPNGNTVADTYYANGQPYTVTEATSAGTTVSSHTYAYDPDGNTSSDTGQLMSANNSGTYLSHAHTYAYSPQDQVSSVTTDGATTESYTHDADNNVTIQTVNGTSTTYGYNNAGQMSTAAVAGGATADYNYDPLGRLDTVTSGGQTLQSSTYDGFDNLSSVSQLTPAGKMATTSYTYDSLNRMATQTTSAGTTNLSYLGASSDVASEADPGGTSKTYDYTPAGSRVSQTTTGATGAAVPAYYSYDAHSDVEALTGASGTTMDTYGYTAYGSPISSMFTGNDQNDASASATSTTTPDTSYRFNAMRWDGTTGQYDMGFRTYDPALNQFTSRDNYDGAFANAGLTVDPFTGGAYAYGSGNPVSNIELNGHISCPVPLISCGGSGSSMSGSGITCAIVFSCDTGNSTGGLGFGVGGSQASIPATCLYSTVCLEGPNLLSPGPRGGTRPGTGTGTGPAGGGPATPDDPAWWKLIAAAALASLASGANGGDPSMDNKAQTCLDTPASMPIQPNYGNLSYAGGATRGRASGVTACLGTTNLNQNRTGGKVDRS